MLAHLKYQSYEFVLSPDKTVSQVNLFKLEVTDQCS